jgi:hypothetical protein
MNSYIKNKDRSRSCEIPIQVLGKRGYSYGQTFTFRVALQHKRKEGAGMELKYYRVDYSPLHFPPKRVRKQQ